MKLPQKIAIALFGLILLSISYFTGRSDSFLLLSQFTVLFGLYLYLAATRDKISLAEITGFALLFRLLLLFLIPNLSEDVFRFIWDGKMWLNGLNAYTVLPSEATNQELQHLSPSLFNSLNSPAYYSIYPPINQLLFYIAALAENTTFSIVIIRLFVLAAEIGTLIILPKALVQFGHSAKNVIWYALNPLVILELTGSLHFEAFIIFFAVLACYHYKKGKWKKSAIWMGFAIAFKLIPVILLAAVFKKLSFKKWFQYCLIAGLVFAISIAPVLFSNGFKGMIESSSLYFKSFEFNGSIYYLSRAFGYWWKNYNIIATTGPLMGILSFISILVYNIMVKKSVSIAEKFMWTWFLYCLFATTLHPWYCLPLLAFGLLTHYKFPILWTFLIFFTYIGYTESGFQENLWITLMEYILLFTFVVFEIIGRRGSKFTPNSK
ncbi:hypothetical protein JKA74_01160 [Marivirga sp. S37H4]|uniref:Mannosyltransferase n=1 Tax=Marivirga aurantiaca TaxID=2802615 RepID=A0A934WVD4_9BACT|nr:glycosyltransferase 87 family protein [Marivirga aurantiaca]MBK6263626.1 hypothetical protein [Marivirga aurantiaca]